MKVTFTTAIAVGALMTGLMPSLAGGLSCADPTIVAKAKEVFLCSELDSCKDGQSTTKDRLSFNAAGLPDNTATQRFIERSEDIYRRRPEHWRQALASAKIDRVNTKAGNAKAEQIVCQIALSFEASHLAEAFRYQAEAELTSKGAAYPYIEIILRRDQDPYEFLASEAQERRAHWSECFNRTLEFTVSQSKANELSITDMTPPLKSACKRAG
ncbi:hypothetical protein AFEL58S_03400 [Afipia felis]